MHRLLSIVCRMLIAGTAVTSSASAATIFLSRETTRADLCPNVPSFQPTPLYVVAESRQTACGGIAGAEFRLSGYPTEAEGWFTNLVWPPGFQHTGDVFNEGVLLEFPCVASESGAIVLLTMDVLATQPNQDRVVVPVLAHQNPSDPQFACPVLTLCDAGFTKICAQGAQSRINTSSSGTCYCNDGCIIPGCPPLAVEHGTWTHVKGLFQ